jgi:hypothetical protein
MEELYKNFLEKTVRLYSTISTSKAEAFLKGYLMGLGCTPPEHNFELMKKNPELWIPIEKDVKKHHDSVRMEHIREAKRLLREIYEGEGKYIPEWLRED